MNKSQTYKKVIDSITEVVHDEVLLNTIIESLVWLKPRTANNYEQYAVRDEKGNLVAIRCMLSGNELPIEEFPSSNVGIIHNGKRYKPIAKRNTTIKRRHDAKIAEKNNKLLLEIEKCSSDECRNKLREEIINNLNSKPDYI